MESDILMSYKSQKKEGGEEMIGRPTDDPKTVRISVRLNAETLGNIEKKAVNEGKTVSEVIREAIKGYTS